VTDARQLSQAIERIYEAAGDGDCLAKLSSALAPNFESGSGLIFLVEKLSDHCVSVPKLAGVPSATNDFESWATAAYSDYYHDRNEWFSRGAKLPIPAIVIGQELIDDAALLRSECYEDYWRKLDIFHILGASFFVEEKVTGAIGFHRPRSANTFNESDRRKLALLVPHLQRSLQLHRRLSNAELKCALNLSIIDNLHIGVMVVAEDRRVLFANRIAERVLRAGDGLTISHGQLTPHDSRLAPQFDKTIGEAARTSAGRGTGAGNIVKVARPSGAPLTLLISPYCASAAGFGPAQPAAMVAFADPDISVIAPEQALAHAYGLTSAETRLLLALLAGQSLGTYADVTGISRNTAKRHLDHIFLKTGQRRQADLIRAFLADPAMKLAH
jgi:DNA-binding CsgD family transcriptional regulator